LGHFLRHSVVIGRRVVGQGWRVTLLDVGLWDRTDRSHYWTSGHGTGL